MIIDIILDFVLEVGFIEDDTKDNSLSWFVMRVGLTCATELNKCTNEELQIFVQTNIKLVMDRTM